MATTTPAKMIAKQGPEGLSSSALVSGGDLLVRERARPVVSTGFRPLDALLPAGGVRPGSLVEWLAEGDAGPGAGGAASLAFAVACRLAAKGGGDAGESDRPRTIVVVDRTGWFHPPAVLPWLGSERRLVVARPSRDDDEIWAIDQALRCTGVAAVLAWPRVRAGGGRRMRSAGGSAPWSTAMRRWQLAAAGSGAVGLFVRPLAARTEPSWAEARVAVSPRPGGGLAERRLQLTLAGGNWSAARGDGRRTAEIVIDLMQGMAGGSRSGVGPLRLPASASVASFDTGGGAGGRSGVTCRAS